MWTARNRQGFLGVTCSFLDKNFTIHEIILTVEYVRYPHTSQHIADTLLTILDEWNLKEKVHFIVTDNGANIKKSNKRYEINFKQYNLATVHSAYVTINSWKRIKFSQIIGTKSKKIN